MAKLILIEELHLSLRVPKVLPDVEQRAVYRTLNARRFHTKLVRAVLEVIQGEAALRRVRVTLSR